MGIAFKLPVEEMIIMSLLNVGGCHMLLSDLSVKKRHAPKHSLFSSCKNHCRSSSANSVSLDSEAYCIASYLKERKKVKH